MKLIDKIGQMIWMKRLAVTRGGTIPHPDEKPDEQRLLIPARWTCWCEQWSITYWPIEEKLANAAINNHVKTHRVDFRR